MILSVLSINNSLSGLFDSNSEKFIMTGTSQEMFKLKHEIEEAEQQKDNDQHFINLIEKYAKMLESIKAIGNNDSNIIQKKIEIFQKLLSNK